MNSINQKLEFMQACGQTVRDTPGTPTIEERKLNLALILEEVYELARDGYGMESTFRHMVQKKLQEEAVKRDSPFANELLKWFDEGGIEEERPQYFSDTHTYDPVATLDALCDIRVVADGPILSSGLQGVWQEAMAEVHASNMSKFTTSGFQAGDFALTAPGLTTHENNGFWCVKNAAGKVQKPNWHFKPDLKSIYERHAHQSLPSS